MEKELIIYSKLILKDGVVSEKPEDIVPYDVIFLSSDTYKKIFGNSLKETEYLPWKRGIVKISYYDDVSMTHKSIYRLWKGLNPNYKVKDYAYIDKIGQSILFGENVEGEKKSLELTKGSKFLFYWLNSNAVVRCSFKLGSLSVIIGIISFALSLISIFS